jgi:hypothetical protein
LLELTANPIFLRTVPDKNPRTECGCQPAAAINSCNVAPPGRFSRSSTWAVLLTRRVELAFFAPCDVFLAGLAFVVAFAVTGVPCRPRFATLAFLVGFGLRKFVACAIPFSSVIDAVT